MARGIPVYPQMPDVRAHGELQEDDHIHAVLLEIRDALVKKDSYPRRHDHEENALWRKESQGYLTIPLSGGAGSLQGDISMRPEKNCSMSVRNITAAGYSAGTVTVSRINGVVIAIFGANGGSVFYGKRQIWLETNDQIVVSAAGITGAPQIYLDSDEMKNWYVATYVG